MGGDQIVNERWAVWSEWQAAIGTFVHVQMAGQFSTTDFEREEAAHRPVWY